MNIKELRQLVAHMHDQRAKRMAVWRELNEHIIPHRGIFGSDGSERLKNHRMVNPAPQISLRRGAAGLTSAMTPSGLPWFRMGFSDERIAEFTHARAWLDSIENSLCAALSRGGFYPAIHSANEEYIGYGCLLIYAENISSLDFDGSVKTRPRYEYCPCGTYAVALDSSGELCAVTRTLAANAAQMSERFGEKKLSRQAREALAKSPYAKRELTHVVLKNPDFDPKKRTAKAMPFVSYFYESGEDEILHQGGFMDMPFMFAAWNNSRGVYGTGPGDEALPDARMLQAMETKELIGLDKTIDPPMRAPLGFRGRVNTVPGSTTLVNNYEKDGVGPLYTVNFLPGIQAVEAKITNVMRRLDETLLASIFADPFFDQVKPGVTATAIMAQRQQRAQLMGPALAAYEPRVLSKVIMRTINLLDAAGELPPVPKPLNQYFSAPKDLVKIEYISPMAQSLRDNAAQSTQALAQAAFMLAQGKPEVLDKIDLDQAVDEIARGLGAPGGVVKSDEEVAAIRAQRQQQQQQMMLMQQAQQMAATIGKQPAAAMPQGGNQQ